MNIRNSVEEPRYPSQLVFDLKQLLHVNCARLLLLACIPVHPAVLDGTLGFSVMISEHLQTWRVLSRQIPTSSKRLDWPGLSVRKSRRWSSWQLKQQIRLPTIGLEYCQKPPRRSSGWVHPVDMETNAILLDPATVLELENGLKSIRAKMWKVSMHTIRQVSASSRESAVIVDDGLSENIVLIANDGTAVAASRSLPDILIHSKLWTSPKGVIRQITGYRWETGSTSHWFVKDETSGYGLLTFAGSLEKSFFDLLGKHTVYLMNKWAGVDQTRLLSTLHAFTKFNETLKTSSFEDAFIRNRSVVG